MASSAWAIRVGVELDVTDIQSQLDKATEGKKLNLDTSGAEGNLSSLQTEFDLTYQAANKVYQMAKEAIKAMTEEVYTVDKALVEFRKVSDLRGNDLEQYTQDLTESGKQVARTTSDMVEAATMFRKSGFSDEEASQLALVATMFQNVSDVSVSAEDAAANIVSQIQAFGRGLIDPMHIIDAYNEVANNFAVGTNDLSNGMEIAAAGLSTYGNTFEESLGMIAAGTEIFTGRSSQIARALMTISSRIHGNADAISALEKLQIPIEDQNGVRSTYQILNDVAEAWVNLGDAERISLQQALAGTTRGKEFAAIMNNWEHAIDATATAMESQGSAAEENSAYMEGLEAKTEGVHAAFQELSQNVVSSDLVSGMLDLAQAFMEMANTDIGTFVTQVGLLSSGLSGIYGVLKAGLLSDLGLPALGTVAPYIIAATTAATGLYYAVKYVKRMLEQKAEIKVFDNVKESIEESEQKINEYDQLITESKQKLEELEQIPWGERSTEIQFEIRQLQDLIKYYEQLREEEEANVRQQKFKQLEKTQFESGYSFVDIDKGYLAQLEEQFVGFTDVYEKSQSRYYKTIQDAALAFGEVMKISSVGFENAEDYSEYVLAALETKNLFLQRQFHTFNEELIQNGNEISNYIKSLGDLTNVDNKNVDSLNELIAKNEDYYNTLKIVKKYGTELNDNQLEFIKQYESLQATLSQVTLGTEKLAEAKDKVNQMNKVAQRRGEELSLGDYVEALHGIEGIDASNLAIILGYLQDIGEIDLDYTASDLENLTKAWNQVEDKQVQMTATVDEESINESEEIIEESLDEIKKNGVTITSSTDAEALVAALESIKTLIAEVNLLSITIKVSIDNDKALKAISTTASEASALETTRTITIRINDYASLTLVKIKKQLQEISQLKNQTITINASQGGMIPEVAATGREYFSGGNVLINDGAPVNGSSAELVVANGEASIYNNGQPIVANIPQGAKIYTAAETQEILKNVKSLKDSIPSFASGNVTTPSSVNASNIQYTPSPYYVPNLSNIAWNNLEAFENWLKWKKHLLELDQITEEQYYLDLEKMNEKYLKNNSEAQDDYWQHQEEVYKWKKQQLEEENKLLEKQIELEKALGELAKVKSQKILVFKNGKFQYMADIDAIAEAQRNIAQIQSGYADGTTNATPGLHLVGEEGPELRVLNKGDGIIPSNLTKNLLDMAKIGVNGIDKMIDRTKEVLYSFNINNLSLPNVSNAENFLNGLKNYAYQYSYS